MNAPRFRVEEKTEQLRLRPSSQRPIKWVTLEKSKSVRELATKAANTPERRLFAVVSRPQPSNSGARPARRVLIFDNHPDTLQLLFSPAAKSEASNFISTTRLVVYWVLAFALTGLAVFALFRPFIAH